MVFTDQGIDEFLENFNLVKHKIRGFEGCTYLELWKASGVKNTFITYSKWKNAEYLEKYRQSALFRETWDFTKARFADKPQAWSVDVVAILP